jgi:hypothetical protein
MNKQFKGFFQGFIVAVLILAFALPALAAFQKQATLNYNDIKIMVNGDTISPKDANGNIVEPFIIDGTTYLPVRAIADAVGLDVAWDGSTSTVILTEPDAARAVYITRTGEKYHYDSTCNGGTYFEVPLQTAIDMGLTPCNKCVGDTMTESSGTTGDNDEIAYTVVNDNVPFFQTMN